MLLSITQARSDKFNVLLEGGDALLRFLLESVQHIHRSGRTHGINGPVGVAVEIIDQLQDSRMGATHFLTKTLPKVATEMALSVLAYNLTRVMNIVGIKPLIAAIAA